MKTQNYLIREANDFRDVIDHILRVRESNIEYLAIAIDEPVSELIALQVGGKLLSRNKLIKLCWFYAEACLAEKIF